MTKRQVFFVITFILLNSLTFGQKIEKAVVSNEDPYNLYNYEPTDTINLFYLKLVPKGTPIGCLVILLSSGELVETVMKQITLHKIAVQKGLLVIFPSLNSIMNSKDCLAWILKQLN